MTDNPEPNDELENLRQRLAALESAQSLGADVSAQIADVRRSLAELETIRANITNSPGAQQMGLLKKSLSS